MEESEKFEKDDEISLIDLLAVLIRRRKLIIGTIILSILLALAFIFWDLQKIKTNQGNSLYKEAVVIIMTSPTVNSFTGDIANQATQFLKEPSFVWDAIKSVGIEKLDGIKLSELDDPKGISLTRRLIIQNKDQSLKALKEDDRLYTVTKEQNILRLNYKSKDGEDAKALLEALLVKLVPALRGILEPIATSMVTSYERKSQLEDPSIYLQADLANAYSSYMAAKQFLDSDESAIIKIGQPYLIVPEIPVTLATKGSYKNMTLIIIAGIFFSILLAFIVNFFDSIKKDPEAMAKIRAAREGK